MPTVTEETTHDLETPKPRLTSGALGALGALGEDRMHGLTLRTRLFLGSASLLAATVLGALFFLNQKAQQVAEAKIREDLRRVPAIFEGYRSTQSAARERQLRSLAEEAGTKALLAEVREHPETFHDTALEYARSLGAKTVFFFDAAGLLLARSDREPGEEAGRDFSGVSWVDTPREKRVETAAFILEISRERTLSLAAAAPVIQGAGGEARLNGVIAAAFPMTDERARELGQLTDSEAAFLGNVAPRGETPRVEVLAHTKRLSASLLGDVVSRQAAILETLRGTALKEPLEFTVSGETFIATLIPIRSGRGELIAAALIARSKDAEMAPFLEIRQSLLLVGVAALVASVPLSFLLAQGLAGPIRKLASGARQIARGELNVTLPEAGGEVGSLARAFAVMVGELKEKTQLEALVAEMQRRPGDITFRGLAPGAQVDGVPQGLGVGRVFAGRYEILSELGKGGMGAVFRARDRELDDEVALKVLKESDDQPAMVERLRQEIKIARAITHPNVVRAFDFGEAEGKRYLTMEYVPGTTLRELVDARRGLELTPALQIAKQVCRGLAAVHRAGIVHGDLKPQNVMVMGSGVAKLMDFGVARPRARQDHGAWVVAGTPLYMSPEQAKGGELDDRSDIYSAGVMMFEMFTGECPFRGKDVAEILQMHLNDPPPDPRTRRAGLPEPLARIILACLSKHRLERPANAGDLDRLLMRVRA